jgi:hypothetical protein
VLLEALTALALGGAPPPFSLGPVPSVVVTSFRADVSTSSGAESIAWQSAERFRVDPVKPGVPGVVERDGTRFDGAAGDFDGTITRHTFPARPDGYPYELVELPAVDAVLGEARGGRSVLRPVTLRARNALRATYRLPANECAALPAGSAEVWLDAETLLPVRQVERRGSRRRVVDIAYTSLNVPLTKSDFLPPVLDLDPGRADQKFRRASPEQAASRLSYAPLLPTALPPGFALAVSGWAPTSGFVGGEAAIAPRRELFAAVYRRGFERLDLTQRLAGRGGWPDDPFGVECVPVRLEDARVAGQPARYGTGPEIVPHLYWRRGRVLFTLAGPFPKADLVAIADSLAPVASPQG